MYRPLSRSLFLILNLFALTVQAQNESGNPTLVSIVPPSPGAASLGKFGDIPVGYATGIPKIGVPIYSYQNANSSLNMSISLDYHAGGVKVDELPSNAGSGWAINAGGVVTRTKMGTPDEYNQGFMNTPVVPDLTEGNKYSVSKYMEMYSGTYDTQADIFNFNVGGKSGKFMFGKNNDFLMLSPGKIKVNYEIASNHFQRFIITDETGTKYIFDAKEITNSGLTGWDVYPSSWYLTKVIAPFATDSILLEYENEQYSYGSGRFGTMTISLDLSLGTRPSSGGISGGSYNGKRISKISFPDSTKVLFTYDNVPRTDRGSYNITGNIYRLKQISINNGTGTRGYNLYHDYSINRLTLKNILPYNAAGEDKGYSFEYYGALPERLSTSQDHWGYYNGNQDGTLYPQEYYMVNSTIYPLNGANRETHVDLVKRGSLTRMIYPTGGYTDFEMEAHYIYDPRLHYYQPTNIQTQFPNSVSGLHCSNTSSGWQPLTFNADPNVTTTFTARFYTGGQSSNNIILQLKNNANQVVNTQTIPFSDPMEVVHNFNIYNLAAGNYTWHASVQGSNYFDDYISIDWQETRMNNPDTTFTYIDKPYVGGLRVKSIKDYDGISVLPVNVREYDYLKEDGVTSSGTLGTYPIYSHGVFYDNIPAGTPVHSDDRSYYTNGGIPNCIMRSTSSVQTLALTNGSPANYTRVVEKFTNNGNSNGKIVRYFTSYGTHSAPVQYDFPYAPPDYSDWTYGLLTKELVYDKDNNLLKKTENEYVYPSDPYYNTPGRVANFTSVSIAPVKYKWDNDNSAAFQWSLIMNAEYFLSTFFTPGTGRSDLSQTRITEYTGTESLVTQINYLYDTAYNVVKTTTQNSRSEQIEDIVHYPYEYTTNTVANAMKAQNMYAPPVSTERWKTIGGNKYLTGGIVNQYQSVASGIRKTSIESFENSSPVITGSVPAFNPAAFSRSSSLFKEAITFNQYNNKGFITQQAKSNDVAQSIIWDHNQQLPIAQVIGSAADKIAYTSFEADGWGGWTMNPGSAIFDNGSPVTGKKVFSGTIFKPVPTGNYVVTLWSIADTWINGQLITQQPTKVIGIWRYFEVKLNNVSNIDVAANTMDEVRLYPQGAQMTTLTYDPLYGLTSQCDVNNRISYYEYDGFGRLKLIRDENKNVLKTFDYQFQQALNQ